MADRRLQVFHAVARHLSFTGAADALFMTQPAVTFQIRQLEEELKTRLLERGHGRVTLTPAGSLVLEYAEKILELSDEMETRLAEMTEEMSGPLLIGASATLAGFFLPHILREFNALYPRIRARLTVANAEAIENRVGERILDLGLIGTLPKNPALCAEACCTDELQLICSPDHPLASESAIQPQVLRDYEYISREPGSGTRDASDVYFRAAGVLPEEMKTLMELGSLEALKGAVGAGLGFAVVSRAACERECRLGMLAAIPLRPALERTLYLVYPRDRFRAQRVSGFIAFVKERLWGA